MIRRLLQWLLFSGVVFVSVLLAGHLAERAFVDVAYDLLRPWFALCLLIIPEAWQVRGNSLLVLLWMFSGFFVYSLLAGAAGVLALAFFDRLRGAR